MDGRPNWLSAKLINSYNIYSPMWYEVYMINSYHLIAICLCMLQKKVLFKKFGLPSIHQW